MLKTMYLSKLPWILFCDINRKFQCPLCILNDCLKRTNKSQINILTLLICSLFWSSILDTIKQILCLNFLTRILNLANIKHFGSHNSLLYVCVWRGWVIVLSIVECFVRHPWPLLTRCQYHLSVVTTKSVPRCCLIFPEEQNYCCLKVSAPQ